MFRRLVHFCWRQNAGGARMSMINWNIRRTRPLSEALIKTGRSLSSDVDYLLPQTTTMLKFVVIALLGSLALASAIPEQYDGGLYIPTRRPHRCGENEIYKSCTSSSCAEATCERPRVGPACTMDCVYGCFCQRGFFRDEEKNCVTRRECPEDSPAYTYKANDYDFQ